MGRPIRIEFPSALYHVTSRGNEQRKIFIDDADRKSFLDILADYHDRFGILIHAYVLMGNHYHLVIETPRGNLVKVMHGINSAYTGVFNRKYQRSGHLFQGRYRAILVDKDNYLLELSRYVHLNPVRAGTCQYPESYDWSSYPSYLCEKNEFSWIENSWILSQFGTDPNLCRKKYRNYVHQGLVDDEKPILQDLFGQIILGQKKFINKIQGMIKEKKLSPEITERKRLRKYPKPQAILASVALLFGVDNRKELTLRGSRDNMAKNAAIYLIKRYSGLTNQAIAEFFGGVHYSAISQAAARFKKRLENNNDLQANLDNIMSNVKTWH